MTLDTQVLDFPSSGAWARHNVDAEDGDYRPVSASTCVTTVMPSDSVAFEMVIETRGNLKLAAERLQCTTSDLIAAIKPRLHELKEYMQTIAILELFQFMPVLSKTLRDNLTALEPGDAVNAYMKLMDQITKITDDKTMTINVNDAAWRHITTKLPPEVIDAYMQDMVQAS